MWIPRPLASRIEQPRQLLPTRLTRAWSPLSAHQARASNSESGDARESSTSTAFLFSLIVSASLSRLCERASKRSLDLDVCSSNGSRKSESSTSATGTTLWEYDLWSICPSIGLLLVTDPSTAESYIRFGAMSAASGGCDSSGSKPWLLRRDSVSLCFDEDLDNVPVTERLRTLGRWVNVEGADAAVVHGHDVTNWTS